MVSSGVPRFVAGSDMADGSFQATKDEAENKVNFASVSRYKINSDHAEYPIDID